MHIISIRSSSLIPAFAFKLDYICLTLTYRSYPFLSTNWRERRGALRKLPSIASLPFFCIVSLLPACLTGPLARSLARESRFQFEITRVAWHSEEEVEVEGRREAG